MRQKTGLIGVLVLVLLPAWSLGGVVVDDAIARWHLDEGAGSVAGDCVGGNDGAVSGASWTTGRSRGALLFDGVDDQVLVADRAGLRPTDALTIEAWACTNELRIAKIAQKGDWKGHGLGLDKYKSWLGHVRTADGTMHTVRATSSPELGRWYHLATTYDGAYVRLFVDGRVIDSLRVSGALYSNSNPVSIGSDEGKQKFFLGTIDEVAIYGRALTPEEILSHAQMETPPTATETTSWGGIKAMFR